MGTPHTVQSIGEQGVLALLQPFSPPDITGDDGAVFASESGKDWVISTDMLTEGVHFSDSTTPAFAVGWRAIAANLSDMAAMGAKPKGVTIALGLPGQTSVQWVRDLYQGMAACLNPWDAVIWGGDLCRSPVRTVAITIVGQGKPGRILYRHGAKPGDWILATGIHGAARAGLECLLHPEKATGLDPQLQQTWIQAHQRPLPRLDLLPSLQALDQWGAAMDTSDGLGDAVLQICRASGVGAELWTEQLPLPPGLDTWVGRETAIAWTLYGGEDFQLVLTLPETQAQHWLTHLQTLSLPPDQTPRVIGRITASPGVWRTKAGDRIESMTLAQGFQHFSPSP